MRYHVKVNDYVLEEVYAEADIRGYAPGWREYQADVEVAPEGTQEFISLARFLGEPEPPPVPPPPPGVELPPALPPVQAYQPEPPPAQHQPAYPPPPPGQEYGQPGFQEGWTGDQPPITQNGLATLGVGLSILALMVVPFSRILGPILSVGGIIVSYVGLQRVRDEPEIYGGRRLATNGIGTGGVGIVVTILLLIFPPGPIYLPSLSAPETGKQYETSDDIAAKVFREINAAQAVYASGIGRGNFATSLADLRSAGLSPMIAELEVTPIEGYKVTTLETVQISENKRAQFFVVLSPVEKDGAPRKGAYSYYLDDSGVVRRANHKDEVANASGLPMTTTLNH